MKDIYINLYSAGGVEDYYIPVPCKGTVNAFEVVANATLVATGTITLARGTTAVNTATAPTGDTAAGTRPRPPDREFQPVRSYGKGKSRRNTR